MRWAAARRLFGLILGIAAAAPLAAGRLAAQTASQGPAPAPIETALYMVPNFHDGCMGWLVDYVEERNFGLYRAPP